MTGYSTVSHSRSTGQAPAALFLLSLVLLVFTAIGPNWMLSLLATGVVLCGLKLLWRPGEPPILLVVFLWAWLGAAVPVFYANWLGRDLEGVPGQPSDHETAIALSLIGALAVGLGMAAGAGRQRPAAAAAARAYAVQIPMTFWFKIFLLAVCGGFLARVGAWLVPGASQPMLALAGMEWAAFFLLAYAGFTHGGVRGGRYLLIAFLFELALNLGGFFSDFKSVFAVTILAAAATGYRLSKGTTMAMGLLAGLMIMFGVAWSGIKQDYRSYVSGGSSIQYVSVGYTDRMLMLFHLIGQLDEAKLRDGADQLLDRIGYVDFFGIALNVVPRFVPHENGAIYLNAVTRPLMPRFLFPDKSAIDDTATTNKYTSGAAGNSAATSISLGYVAEAYIDFGRYGMMLMLALVGFFYGRIYQMLAYWKGVPPLIGFALTVPILLHVGMLENSFTKLFGGLIAAILVAVCILVMVGRGRFLPTFKAAPERLGA